MHGGGRWRGEKDWKRDKVGFEMNLKVIVVCTNFKYWKVEFFLRKMDRIGAPDPGEPRA